MKLSTHPGGASVVDGPGSTVVDTGDGAVVVVTGGGVGAIVLVTGFPDPEQRLESTSVTLSILGKLENAKLKLILIWFPFDWAEFHVLLSNEQILPEHCMFVPSQTVKVAGEENSISTFQDDTVFGKVKRIDPLAPVDQVLVNVTMESHDPDDSPEPFV